MSGSRIADRAWAAWVAAAVPPLCITLLVAMFAVDVPYWDTWDWLERHYGTDESGPVSLVRRYWALFNDHRVFVPLLVDRMLFDASSIDILPRVYLKLPLSIATLFVTLALVRRTAPAAPRLLVTAAVALLAFPLTYWPMWMDPRQFSLHIVVLAMAGALYVASGASSERRRLIACGVLCATAALSYAPGALAWPFVGLLLVSRSAWPRRVAITWSIAALASVLPHLIDLRGATHASNAASTSVPAAIHAAAAVAGLPVAPSLRELAYAPTWVMGTAGVATLVALGIVAVRRTGAVKTRALPWLALGGWSAAYALVTGWTRGGLPIGALHDPRFAYLAVQLWVALVGLGAVMVSDDRERCSPARLSPRLLHAAIAILLVVYAVASLRPFLAPGGIGRLSATLADGRACLLRYQTAEDACLELLYPSAAKVREIAARLDARGAAFLREGPAQPESTHRQQHHAVSQEDRGKQPDPGRMSGRVGSY
jgi:hypothetical protein